MSRIERIHEYYNHIITYPIEFDMNLRFAYKISKIIINIYLLIL